MMKFQDSTFEKYFAYLNGIKDKLPAHVYEFASDLRRYELNDALSLHDSWITSLTIRENRARSRPFKPAPSIELVLLGQRHDREMVLEYYDVQSYRIEGHKNPTNWLDTFHGDVTHHEVSVSDEGSILHELVCRSGSVLCIKCKDFKCTERDYI